MAAIMIVVALFRITRILRDLKKKGLVKTSGTVLNIHILFAVIDVVVSVGIQWTISIAWSGYTVVKFADRCLVDGEPPAETAIIRTILSQRIYDFINQLAMLAIAHLVNLK